MDTNLLRIQKEKFILAVLEAEAFSEEKEIWKYHSFKLTNDQRIECDAYAPYGLGTCKGPTVFEIIFNIKRLEPSIKTRLKRLSKKNIEVNNIVFICPYVELDEPLNLPHLFDGKNIVYWDNGFFKRATEDYKQEYIKYLSSDEEIFSDYSDYVLIQNNTKYIHSLRELFKRNRLVFVLGAGVSYDYGSQTWDNLVKDFECDLVSNLKLKSTVVFNDIKTLIGNNQITSIQLWKDVFLEDKSVERKKRQSNQKRYFKLIFQALYPKGHKNLTKADTILKAIAKLYVSKKSISDNQIITYNYDNHLETELLRSGVNYTAIFLPEQINDKNLSIYHVHGYLPRNYYKLSAEEKKKLEDSIVLSEHDYYTLYNNPMLWNTSIQLSVSREKTCLFIGHSLRDPNLFRLYKMMKDENSNMQHYAIIKIENKYNPAVYNLFQKRLSTIGIDVIWVENYDEIPKVISMLQVK